MHLAVAEKCVQNQVRPKRGYTACTTVEFGTPLWTGRLRAHLAADRPGAHCQNLSAAECRFELYGIDRRQAQLAR